MSPRPMDELIGDTLAMVNVVRMALGGDPLNELPESTRGASTDCLFYRAFSDFGIQNVSGGGYMEFADERVARVAASAWGVEAAGRGVQAPAQFGRVINAFDHNQLPHYNTPARP